MNYCVRHRAFFLPISILCLVCLFSAGAFAQEEPRKEPDWNNTIETDGPDFTEASSVIPQGTIQVETGMMLMESSEGNSTTRLLAYPTTLVRIGILKSAELRIIGEYNDFRTKRSLSEPETKTAGMTPLLVGTKLFICEEKGLRPQASFIGHLVLPTGSRNFRPDFTAAEFRFSLSNTITEKLDAGYNIGYEWDGFSVQGQAIYTLALGYQLTKRWGAYVEVFGNKPEREKFAHALAGGIKFFIAPNWQVDISGGHGLNEEAFDYYMAYGLRFRLPY